MATSKRFKKKCKNFRQGMTAWRIWGWTISPVNALDWASDKERMDSYHGEGNWVVLPLNSFKGFEYRKDYVLLYVERICAVDTKDHYGTVVKAITKRSKGKGVWWRAGSLCNRFFAKQKQAQSFLQDVKSGLRMEIVEDLTSFHDEIDYVDGY